VQGLLAGPGLSLQAQPSGGAAHDQISASDPALNVVAGRAMSVKGGGMKRAKKAVPLLAVLFLAMPSNGERFGHVAKAQTIASVLALKSAAKAMLAMTRRRPRAMRSCQSRITMSGF